MYLVDMYFQVPHKVHQNHLLIWDVNVYPDHIDNVFVFLVIEIVFDQIHIEFVFEMHLLMY
jgi:hypothetical protein